MFLECMLLYACKSLLCWKKAGFFTEGGVLELITLSHFADAVCLTTSGLLDIVGCCVVCTSTVYNCWFA